MKLALDCFKKTLKKLKVSWALLKGNDSTWHMGPCFVWQRRTVGSVAPCPLLLVSAYLPPCGVSTPAVNPLMRKGTGACSNSRGHFQFAHFHCHLAFLEYFCYYLHYGSVILTHDWYWYAGHNCEKIKLKCYKFKDISRNQGFEFILE